MLMVQAFNGAYAAVVFSEDCVDLEEINPPNGSIYFGEKNIFYSLEMQNPENKAYNINLSFEVTGRNGETAFVSDTENFKLGAKSRLIKGLKIENEFENDIYEIKVSLRGDFGTIEKKESFSVAEENTRLSDFMGFSTHFGKQYREHIDDSDSIISNGGFGWIRDEIYWDDVETSSGKNVPAYADNYVDTAIADGKKVLLVLGLTHPSYDSGAFPTSDKAIAAYADYCGFMAEHFKGKIDTFEIWNEPDLYTKSDKSAVSGADYAKLVMAAHNAIIKAQPEATVVVGALSEAIGSEDFLREMLGVSGVGECIDVLSVHPYANTGYYSDENTYKPNRNILRNVNLVKNALGDAGLSDVPVWITEYGTSSNTSYYGYSEEEQAINLVRASVLTMTDSRIEKFFIYNLKEKGKDETAVEDNFGVLEYAKTKAKPAFLALSYMNKTLGDAKFSSFEAESVISSRVLSKASFKNNKDEDIFVLWATKVNNSSATLNIAYDKNENEEAEITDYTLHSYKNGSVEVYDLYGNQINTEEGIITVDEAPIYIICRKNNLDIEEIDGKVKISGLYAKENSDITVVARKENSVAKEASYINQTKADAYGKFSFNLDLNDGDIYKLYIYDGNLIYKNSFGNENYDIDIDYFVNDLKLTSPDEIKTGDTVTVNMAVDDLENLGDSLMAMAIIYKNNGEMRTCDISKSEWTVDSKTVLSLEVKITDKSDTLKFMLWDYNNTPEFDAVVLEK